MAHTAAKFAPGIFNKAVMNYVMYLLERSTSCVCENRVLLGEGGCLNLRENVKKNT
jgi:hypothetical protein